MFASYYANQSSYAKIRQQKQLVLRAHAKSQIRCERAFSESFMAASLVDVTKFACQSLEFQRSLYVISNGVKNG